MRSHSKVNANNILYFLRIGIQINTQYVSPFKVSCWIRFSSNVLYSLIVFFQNEVYKIIQDLVKNEES